MTRSPAVYILASDRNGTLYTGVTSDLIARTWHHREHIVDGFTKRYDVAHLVCYEIHGDMHSAITREKQIKKWNRAWKLRLIQENNPQWKDLWPEITGQTTGMDDQPSAVENPAFAGMTGTHHERRFHPSTHHHRRRPRRRPTRHLARQTGLAS